MLTHTYPHKPWRKISETICNHQIASRPFGKDQSVVCVGTTWKSWPAYGGGSLLKVALAHCAGVQTKVLGRLQNLIGVMRRSSTQVLVPNVEGQMGSPCDTEQPPPHDQGIEGSQLCGANLKEGSLTGL